MAQKDTGAQRHWVTGARLHSSPQPAKYGADEPHLGLAPFHFLAATRSLLSATTVSPTMFVLPCLTEGGTGGQDVVLTAHTTLAPAFVSLSTHSTRVPVALRAWVCEGWDR